MGPITVVKCGGNADVDARHVCADVARLVRRGERVVLVHGGSADIDRLCAQLGVPTTRLVAPDGVSARYTDAATLAVVGLALAGVVKPRLVTALVNHGVCAVGLTGWDGGLLRARRKTHHRAMVEGRRMLVRDDHSGRIVEVNRALLRLLLEADIVPVVSPPALAEDGGVVNTDADRAAAAVAGALGATTLIMLTGAPGVLKDSRDENSLLATYVVPRSGPPAEVGGGMGLKLVAAREALLSGVAQVYIGDGRREQPVLAVQSGHGTRVVLAKDPAAAEEKARAAA